MALKMITNQDIEEFAEFLVAWFERDLKAGRVKTKPPADVPEALPQSLANADAPAPAKQ
jgi:hypothetical protein